MRLKDNVLEWEERIQIPKALWRLSVFVLKIKTAEYPIARRRFKIVGIKNHPDEIPQAKQFDFSF